MAILTCKDLCFAYDGSTVLEGVNFSLNAGNYLCVVGENGSGKSTLMKGLLGLKSPDRGSIAFGEGLKSTEIGYLPQQTAVQRDFPATVQEVVLSGFIGHLGWRFFYGRKEKDMARRHMSRLGLDGMEKQSFRELSGGQRQRVLLARALCAAKRLLLLDEPTAGLDPAMQAEMYRLVQSLCQEDGMGIIMVSHDLHEAVGHATHILLMGPKPFWGTREDYQAMSSDSRFSGTKEV
jgi:zinc transport system ATP-binding protein